MTTPTTVSDYVNLARAAIAAGDFAAAETATNQAKAIKSLDDLTPKVDAAARPQFGDADPADPKLLEATVKDVAIKAWYAQEHPGKDIDHDTERILSTMYNGSYKALRYAKQADFVRFIRSGRYDPALKSMVVYTPEQVLAEIAGGMSVDDLVRAQKATQVESQDTSGGLAKAA